MEPNKFCTTTTANIDFTQDMIADISLALLNSGISGECKQCHKGTTIIVPAASITVLQNAYPVVYVNGRVIICAVTICDRCGHKEEYDLQRLGLLDKFLAFFREVLEKNQA